MLRWCVAAGLLVVSLSGCSSGPEAGPTVATPSITSPSSSTAVVAPILRTDTLHLMDAPHLAGTLPASSVVIRVPLPSDSVNTAGNKLPEWRLPLPDLLDLRTTLHVNVDVEGVVTSATASPACFWIVDMAIQHRDGGRTGLSNYCFQEQPVVPQGIRSLEFSVPQTLESAAVPGDDLVFSLGTFGFYSPGATVELLTGTVEADSTITIEGLQLPVDTQTLL